MPQNHQTLSPRERQSLQTKAIRNPSLLAFACTVKIYGENLNLWTVKCRNYLASFILLGFHGILSVELLSPSNATYNWLKPHQLLPLLPSRAPDCNLSRHTRSHYRMWRWWMFGEKFLCEGDEICENCQRNLMFELLEWRRVRKVAWFIFSSSNIWLRAESSSRAAWIFDANDRDSDLIKWRKKLHVKLPHTCRSFASSLNLNLVAWNISRCLKA